MQDSLVVKEERFMKTLLDLINVKKIIAEIIVDGIQ
jgi:hypothetical protein